VLSKLVQVVASPALGKRQQARDCGVVVAGEGEPPFGGAFVGRVFGVWFSLFVGESPPNKATGADGRFTAFIAGFVVNCVLVAAAHWRSLYE
jgi:hypothetical protein